MRHAITISLPDLLVKTVDRAVRSGGYATTSEFFRTLVRRWQEEETLARMVVESEKEFVSGKGKTLRSLRSLRGAK